MNKHIVSALNALLCWQKLFAIAGKKRGNDMRAKTLSRRLILWLAIPVILLLLLIAGLFWTTRDWGSPSQTLGAFCRALVARDYATAYTHLSHYYQDRLPYDTFVATYSSNNGAGPVTACRVKNIHSEELFGTLALTYANGTSAEKTFSLATENLFFWKLSPDSV
jgi:hypothetical protein